MTLEKSPKECLVCLNTIETILVPTEESQKIFNVCCSYIKDAINIELLINNFIGNDYSLSFCKNCLDCSLNLSQLVEQVSMLKKQINDLTSSFSENISKQRVQATAAIRKKQLGNSITKFHSKNQQTANLDSSERLLPKPNEMQSESLHHSFIQLEASNQLIVVEPGPIDAICKETMKTENDSIFLDCGDESGTDDVHGYDEEEYGPNYLMTENEQEIDPLGAIELKPTYGNIITEPQPPIEMAKSFSESVSSVTMPKILKRIRDQEDCNIGNTSTNTPCQDTPGINLIKNLPCGSDFNFNSTTMKSSVKHKRCKRSKTNKKFYCPICQKNFATARNLKRHYLTHTGEKPFQCGICKKSFTQSHCLKIHERIHTGEKPYHCSSCSSSFSTLDSLKCHEKSHKCFNERPYKCSHCKAAFMQLKDLRIHEISHTSEVPFECP